MNSPSKSKAEVWIPIIIAILTLVAGGGWGKVYFDHKMAEETKNEQLKIQYLSKIKTLLETNKSIKDLIYAEYREGNWGVLESYVEKVKKGEDKVAIILMASDIGVMESNNKKAIELLTEYSGNVITSELDAAIPKFIKHAQNWVNRASQLSEIVKTGSQYPYAEPFPESFMDALQEEINARERT